MDGNLTGRALRGQEIFNITKQLRLACCAVASRSCSYLDVYSADQVPTLEKLCAFSGARKRKVTGATCCYRARSFIANTEPAARPGYHWVAFVVFANHPSIIYFFDSFGMPLSYYQDLYHTCMDRGYYSDTVIVTPVNSRALQGSKSTVCGHYCVLYLYLCARMSLETLRARVQAQGGFALGAMRALVLVTGGIVSNDRDVVVVHILNELLKRNEQLTPAFTCSRIGSTAARSQCCQPRK
jgi:Adenovirus endoprotease